MTSDTIAASDRTSVTREAPTLAAIVIVPEHVLAGQLAAITGLVATYVATKLFYVLGGHDQLLGFAYVFDLDEERNAPSIYSALAILAAAALLVCNGIMCRKHRRPDVGYWYFLTCVFLLLAYDEAFSLHERLVPFVRDTFNKQRPGHLNWVVGGIAFAALVGGISIRFVFRLPPRTRLLMLASGLIFVTGAIGCEVLGGWRLLNVPPSLTQPDAAYFALVLAEETCEMLGIALFNYALLDHLRADFGALTVRFRR